MEAAGVSLRAEPEARRDKRVARMKIFYEGLGLGEGWALGGLLVVLGGSRIGCRQILQRKVRLSARGEESRHDKRDFGRQSDQMILAVYTFQRGFSFVKGRPAGNQPNYTMENANKNPPHAP